MAFINTNAVQYGNETVDTRFSPLVEPNLYAGQVFQPNVSYTDKYQMDQAGQVFVRKLGKATVDTDGGLTFTHNQTADALISIVLDNDYKLSEAIYEEVETARTSGTGVQKFEEVMAAVQEKWQTDAMTALVAGATASAVTAVTDIATDAANVKEAIIATRKELKDNSAMPDTIMVSTRFFAGMLEFSGREYQPNTNDEVLRTGALGKFFGMNVYETELLTDDGLAGSTEFVMYDHRAFSILSRLIAARIIDAGKDWVGSAAQVHIKSAFTVTNADRVYKKIISA